MNKKLKLYVWTNFCKDYGPGLAFAVAENLLEAKAMVIKEYYDSCFLDQEWIRWGDLHVHDLDEKVVFMVPGGA